MARPNYNLRESLYPALGALGTYTSNLAQYSGQMTPYRRDPRLDQQRAFGDALMAYMQAVPQREQMFQNRQQLAIDRKRQKEIDDRQRQLFPYQLEQAQRQKTLQELQIRAEENKLKTANNWESLVRGLDNATDAEKQEMLRVGPSLGMPLYQKIVSRGVTQPLTSAQINSLPERLRSVSGLYHNVGGQIKEKFPNAGSIVKDIIKLENTGNWKAIDPTDTQAKIEQGVPEKYAEEAIVHVWTGGGESKAPKIVIPSGSGKDFDAESNLDYVLQANTDFKNGKRTLEDVQSDLRYTLSYNQLFGKQLPKTFVDEQGRTIQTTTPASPAPAGLIKPRMQQQKTTVDNSKVTDQQIAENAFTQDPPNEKIVLDRQPMSTGRKKEVQKGLNGLSNLAFEIRKYEEDLNENGFLIPFYDDSEQFGFRNNTFRSLQDAIRVGKGYGAPQQAELKLLEEAIGNPQNPDLFINVFKTGGNARKYVLGQLEKLKEWVKLNSILYRYEQETGKVLNFDDANDRAIIQKLIKESEGLDWDLGGDIDNRSSEFGKKSLSDMEALIAD